MFCINCGKELNEGVAFCIHCGYKQEREPERAAQQEQKYTYTQNMEMKSSKKKFEPEKLLKNISVYDIGIIGFYGAVILKWVFIFIMNFRYMWDTVSYNPIIAKILFLAFYVVLFLLPAAVCGGGIWFTIKKNYRYMISLALAGIGFVLKIGSFIVRLIPWNSFLYSGGIAISIFGSAGLYLIVMGLLCTIFLYAKNTSSI